MIITLKKADFSSKNIGTLSTWSITKILTGVTTTDIALRVDRGSSYNAVFTVMDGYTLNTQVFGNLKVTIGGEQNNGCTSLSDDNRTITVNIAASELTGNVVITIIADKDQTDEPGIPDEPDEPTIQKLSTPVIELINYKLSAPVIELINYKLSAPNIQIMEE